MRRSWWAARSTGTSRRHPGHGSRAAEHPRVDLLGHWAVLVALYPRHSTSLLLKLGGVTRW